MVDHDQHRSGRASDLPMNVSGMGHGDRAEHGQGHGQAGHGGGAAGPGQAIDPVCGMTVDIAQAESRGLHYRHEDVDYYFCGRGCRLDFEEDAGRYLDPDYNPSM